MLLLCQLFYIFISPYKFLLIHFINCQVSKTYREEKMLLEEYVFIIKAKVGLSAFVQAVGIGKVKQDLTGIFLEASN